MIPKPTSQFTRPAASKAARPHGTYQLAIALQHAVRCNVGKFGVVAFPKGRYIYTGSAKRHLAARVARHLGSRKRLHWHIDYLLAQPGSRVTGVLTFAATECEINKRTPGQIVVPGFGSSDCRAGCGSHLKFQGKA